MCVGHLKIFLVQRIFWHLICFLLLNSTAKTISRVATAHLCSQINSSEFFVQGLVKLDHSLPLSPFSVINQPTKRIQRKCIPYNYVHIKEMVALASEIIYQSDSTVFSIVL